jgi:hypothetical protein
MQHRTPSCQLDASDSRHSAGKSPSTDVDVSTPSTLVHGAAQEIEYTASRWTAPRKWLKSVAWLIGSGLHSKANATTQRVADDLAARMDYTTGHARYCLLETADRLGIDKATVKRHIKYLRELGALVWVQHGTRTNVRPMRDLPGYAATATVYAAAIPASYDHAMGHTIIGSGYTARIVIDQRGQTSDPVDTRGNTPVDNSGSEGLAPPSRSWVKEEGQVQMGGGFNYTSQARPPKTRVPHQSSQIGGRRRTAADVQKASSQTRLVRAMVNWTQSVGLRELEFVLRPWTDRGQDAYQIAADLNGMCAGMRWRPKNPTAFIRARLAADKARRQEIQAAQTAADQYEVENPAPGAFQGSIGARLDFMTAHQQGLARYQKAMRARGHDDLSDSSDTSTWNAEADILAFLNGSPA